MKKSMETSTSYWKRAERIKRERTILRSRNEGTSASKSIKMATIVAMALTLVLCQSTPASAFVPPVPRAAVLTGRTNSLLTKSADSRQSFERSQATRRFSSSEDKQVLDQVISNMVVTSAEASPITHEHVYRDAIRRTLAWVAAAIAFGAGLFFFYDSQAAEEFFAGYLLEQSLSVDNLLVFLLLFEYFQVPINYQDRVLNWGIIGAMVMRAIMIGAGAVALSQFHQVLLVFAGILIYSSAKVLLSGDDDDDEEDLSENQIVQFATKFVSSTDKFDGDRFFTLVDGVKKATPLFLCMVAVEISDVVFAVDSIPAVFGVTENPLIVFSSNIFAIMGLRSLYTILSKAASELDYLEPAVAVVLGFIGSKMVAEYCGYVVPTEVSLGVVLTMLGTGIGASLWKNSRPE